MDAIGPGNQSNVKLFRSEYKSHYDVIIIGAGIGGLFCANLLAEAGLKVLLIEQHYMLGGFCSTFQRKKYIFDAATHFYPLLGNPETLTGRLLQELDIPTQWIKMDPVDKFHFVNDETFVVPAEFSEYLERLKKRFPGQRDQIDLFFREVREAYLYGLLYYFKDISSPKAEKYKDFTLLEKLEQHFQDEKLQAYLMADHSHWGSLPARTSFLFDSMLRLAYFLGNYYPRGSSQVFADDLGEGLRRRGGDVLIYTMVEKILIEDERAVGVVATTRSKRNPIRVEFRAPVVVSNSDALLTYKQLIGEEHCGRHAIHRMEKLRPSLACYLLHLGLTGMDHALLEEVKGYHWFSWNPEDLTRTFFKVFFTTLLDPSIAPPGGDILIVQKWEHREFDEKTDWPRRKQETEEYVLSRLNQLLPGLEDHIAVKMSATAQTSYRYTLNSQGSMLGWEMSPDQLGDDRPGNETPVENLYLVGHWTRPGGGITPVIVSAQKVAHLILSGKAFEGNEFPAQDMEKAKRLLRIRTGG